jgi:hypothetical protein
MFNRDYERDIRDGLDRAHKSATQLERDINDTRLIVFSDHHKGSRDGADDFQRCEAVYHAALGYYHELDFTLVDLGDVEELWEVRPKTALKAYTATLQLESQFHPQRYWRVYGNHDDEWMNPGPVKKHLGPIFAGISVTIGYRLVIKDVETDLGEILFVHGHQGTLFSDRFRWFSRLAVRYVWRPIQRVTNVKSTTPSTDWELCHKHDIAMYNWAITRQKLVLIAGHTHHPVFPAIVGVSQGSPSASPTPQTAGGEQAAQQRAEAEYAKVIQQQPHLVTWEQMQPCYFNGGCCSYSDGTITGIEIADSQIRLVRWSAEEGHPTRQVLGSMDLRDVLGKVAGAGTPIDFDFH